VSGSLVPEVERVGVFVDAATADSLRDIQRFLNARTWPGDFVYFFPNEAIYYFLFNRRNPTRYAISYFAVSTEQRLELVKDLERRKPRYVVYSPATWRVDNIPERIQVPEVVAYLQQKYHAISKLRGVVILERNHI
jgi:transposase InsO family protein